MKNKKENPIQFNETDDLPDIRFDNIFKAVFTKDTPESKGALSGLISAVIGRKITVETITANEPAANNTFDRSIRFDIASKAQTGELVNVEMTFFPAIYEPVRLEYYTSRKFSGQYIQGNEYDFNDLVETFQISIIGSSKIYGDEVLVHTFEYYDKVHKVSMGGKSKIIIVELLKVESLENKPVVEMSTSEKWSFFLQCLTNKKKRGKINEILKEEEGIAMAGETLVNISQYEIEFERQTAELKRRLDHKCDMVSARKIGLAEGLEKGKLEIAQKMKNAGRPISEIEEFTGLSLESIKEL